MVASGRGSPGVRGCGSTRDELSRQGVSTCATSSGPARNRPILGTSAPRDQPPCADLPRSVVNLIDGILRKTAAQLPWQARDRRVWPPDRPRRKRAPPRPTVRAMAKPSVWARNASKAAGHRPTMAAISLSSTRRTSADAPGFTSSSACNRCAIVVLMPGGLTLRSRPMRVVSIAAACSSQSTARRGLHTQAAKSSGHRQLGRQPEQRLADDGREERAGGAVGPAGADDDRRAGGSTTASRKPRREASPGSVRRRPSVRRSCSPAPAAHRRRAAASCPPEKLATDEVNTTRGGLRPRATRRRQASTTASVPRRLTRLPEVVVGLGLGGDHGGEVEDHVGARRDGRVRQVDEVARQHGDRECGVRRAGGSARSNRVRPVIGRSPSLPSRARRAATLRPRKPPPPRY